VVSGKFEWKLFLYPAGHKEENKDHVGLFVDVTCDIVGPWEVTVKRNIQISVNGGGLRDIQNTIKYTKESNTWGWHEFIEIATLKNALEEDGTLIIDAEVEIFEGWNTASVEVDGRCWHKEIYIPESDFSEDILNLLTDGEAFSDVTFIVKEKRFPVHKAILSTRSSVFRAMFTSGMRESKDNEVHIEDTNEIAFKQMLDFIYSGGCDKKIIKEKTADILALANRYNLTKLALHCEKVLLKHLTVENATKTLVVADTYNCEQLRKLVIEFMVENFYQILNVKSFKKLCINKPSLVVEVHEALAASLASKKMVADNK